MARPKITLFNNDELEMYEHLEECGYFSQLEEEQGEPLDEERRWEIANDHIYWYYQDFLDEFNKPFTDELGECYLLCVSEDYNNWRVSGKFAYKRIKVNSLQSLIHALPSKESFEIYLERGQLRFKWSGHDNPMGSTCYIRLSRPNSNIINILDSFMQENNRKGAKAYAMRNTKSLAPLFQRIWDGN